jgi:carboxyl-terminal processing protease
MNFFGQKRVEYDLLNLKLAKGMKKKTAALKKRYDKARCQPTNYLTRTCSRYLWIHLPRLLIRIPLLNPANANFNIEMSFVTGIGASLASENEYVTIKKTIVPGGPADKSKQLSTIVAVGVAQGNKVEFQSVGWQEMLAALIRGVPKALLYRSEIMPSELPQTANPKCS